MKKRLQICVAVLLIVIGVFAFGCVKPEVKQEVRLVVKVPPIGLGKIPGVGEAEIYDFFVSAAEKFEKSYRTFDVKVEIVRYFYLDEKEQIVDKRGTADAADIFYSGSYNTPTYAKNGWLVPLDDLVDEPLRNDIDETIWAQNKIDGKLFVMPFQQFQNTLMVNKTMMKAAGLDAYIPDGDAVAQWTTEEFDGILKALKESLKDAENKFPFMMYAKNNQGDSHIMTLLRAFGCPLYDENGNFAVNSEEGIRALEWLKQLSDGGVTPKGPENLELLSCVNLFNNAQLAICVGNLSNLHDAWAKGLDVFLANFPSPDGKGYATSSVNGFSVFDNGDETKIRAAKDFIRFLYGEDDLMKYTLGTLPVNRSVIETYQDEIPMLKAYGDNVTNVVEIVRNNQNWQGVRDVFYLKIRDLLLGVKTPAETAAAIDSDCNAALNAGRTV